MTTTTTTTYGSSYCTVPAISYTKSLESTADLRCFRQERGRYFIMDLDDKEVDHDNFTKYQEAVIYAENEVMANDSRLAVMYLDAVITRIGQPWVEVRADLKVN